MNKIKDLFDLEGSFNYKLTVAANILILDLLWFVCCIPIITIGPSFIALDSVLMKILDGKSVHLTHDFFSAFRSNFKIGIGIWGKILLLTLILLGDFLISRRVEFAGNVFFMGCSVVLLSMTAVVGFNTVIVVLRTDHNKRIFRTAFMLSVINPFFSLVILATFVFPIIIFLISQEVFLRTLPIWLIGATGFLQLLDIWLMNRVIKKINKSSMPEKGENTNDNISF